jgi:hypothetical protein
MERYTEKLVEVILADWLAVDGDTEMTLVLAFLSDDVALRHHSVTVCSFCGTPHRFLGQVHCSWVVALLLNAGAGEVV